MAYDSYMTGLSIHLLNGRMKMFLGSQKIKMKSNLAFPLMSHEILEKLSRASQRDLVKAQLCSTVLLFVKIIEVDFV